MQPHAFIVNTARGEVIDEKALIKLLQEDKIAGAGLDVFEEEPAVDRKLMRLAAENRVVLLPHMGSATIEGRIEMGEKVIINIRTLMDGHRPPDRILPGRERLPRAEVNGTASLSRRRLISVRERVHLDGRSWSKASIDASGNHPSRRE